MPTLALLRSLSSDGAAGMVRLDARLQIIAQKKCYLDFTQVTSHLNKTQVTSRVTSHVNEPPAFLQPFLLMEKENGCALLLQIAT